LALSTGATFINLSKGMSAANVTLADLGTCKTVEITKGWTTVAGGAADHEQVAEQITSLKAELEQTDSLHECEKIQERITRLASGVAVIRVGAATEVEMTEKRHRIEDALEAVRSAQQEGIVPGGGVALIRASESLGVTPENEEQRCGIEIVKNAVYAPLYQMAKNAGESADLIVSKVMEAPPEYGWDFHKGGLTEMISSGIIDPVKVTRSALQNAASAAGTLFTTSHAIIAG
jgi:chaperonin GroEL